jgi:hypothetical protein
VGRGAPRNGACTPGSSVIAPADQRRELWRSLGAAGGEADELVGYATEAFDFAGCPSDFPLPDEPFVGAWRSYAESARTRGVLPCLQQSLLELRFPVEPGISETDAYRAATRRGDLAGAAGGTGLELTDPQGLSIVLHPTPVGTIPVLIAGARRDFESLVQALTRRNEPWPVPESMGACLVSGYNDWGRVFELRRQWEEQTTAERTSSGWATRFREIAAHPQLYQDRFIILSSGTYSGVPAAALGLGDEEWNRLSMTIRLEHECTHYFTRLALGSMRDRLTDELIADYMGIVAATGHYRPDWFLRFMGLERFPQYRTGGRLQNYRGDPPLSPGAFAVLQLAVHRAAANLAVIHERRWGRRGPVTAAEKSAAIVTLARLGLEGLAGAQGAQSSA